MADKDTGVVASSVIQISSLYDVRPISAYIKANNSLSQLYNPGDNSYNPDFSKEPLLLTAAVIDPVTHQEMSYDNITVLWSYQLGANFGQITTTDSTKGWYLSGEKGQVLNIKENFSVDTTGANFTALVSYKDLSKNTTSTSSIVAKVDFNNLTKSSIVLNSYAPSGYNIINGLPKDVSLSGDLYSNGLLDTNTKRKNSWFRQDTSVVSKDNPLYDERAGLGWAKITKQYQGATPNTDFDEDTITNAMLTVHQEDVINIESYKVLVTPIQGEHIGAAQTGFFTVYNFDSAFSMSIQSPDGTVFKNGSGSKHLKAVVYNSVGEVDADGTKYNYFWYLYKDGTLDPNFGGSGKKIGKTILVNSDEIDNNSTLEVELDY